MSRRWRSVASRSQTMLMGPGQCHSAHDGELCGRARRNSRAFMKVEARGLAADLDEIAMDAKDIAAHADERHLGFGYPMDGCVAFCRRDTRDGAARGHDLSDQRRHGDDGAIHSRLDRKSTRLNSSQ